MLIMRTHLLAAEELVSDRCMLLRRRRVWMGEWVCVVRCGAVRCANAPSCLTAVSLKSYRPTDGVLW